MGLWRQEKVDMGGWSLSEVYSSLRQSISCIRQTPLLCIRWVASLLYTLAGPVIDYSNLSRQLERAACLNRMSAEGGRHKPASCWITINSSQHY